MTNCAQVESVPTKLMVCVGIVIIKNICQAAIQTSQDANGTLDHDQKKVCVAQIFQDHEFQLDDCRGLNFSTVVLVNDIVRGLKRL